MQIKPGARFRSAVCEVEVVVVKAPSGDDIDLRCGGHAMLPIDVDRPSDLATMPGFDDGAQLGKRYVNDSGDIEVLCTKAGPSSLSIDDTVLRIKEAKPLPSSD